ncbi:MAG: hypothetical protein ACYC2U_04525 [Candidatus Amoebophilus sp.]
MRKSYNINQQFAARILLVSLFLQSCGGISNSFTPINEEPATSIQTYTQEEIISQINIESIIGQELTAQGGHAVTFYEEAGQLKADIVMNAPQGFSKTYEGLSVTVEQGAELAKLPCLEAKAQERRIHFQLAQGSKPAKVVIYKGAGLMGGSSSKDKRKGKEKLKEGEEPDGEKENDLNWQNLNTANFQEESHNYIINLFNDEIDKLVEELRSLEGDKKVNYIPTLIYEIGDIDKAIENPTVRSIISKIRVHNKLYLILAEIFEIVLTRNYDSKYLPSIKNNLQKEAVKCRVELKNAKKEIQNISEGIEDQFEYLSVEERKERSENAIKRNTIILDILTPLLKQINSFIEKYEEEIIDKLFSSAVPVIKKATLNSLSLKNCKISNEASRKPTREFYYSDSEDEDAPHYNGIYNLTKFGILDIDNPNEVYDEFKTSFVENYVTEWKQILLRGDAAAIHPAFKALNTSKITVLCVALRQQEDGRIKKFVFTNQPSLMQHEKTKGSLNVIAKLAHKRGYHVIMTQQSHAEAGLIQFLQERPKRYTHIVAIDCSRTHCPLCKKILEDFTEKEILKKVSTSGEADKNSERWFITQAMKDKEFPCPKPDEIPNNVKIKCKQWGEKEEECHRKLELEEWLHRPWAQGKLHKVKLRSLRQASPQKRKMQEEELPEKGEVPLDSSADGNIREQERQHLSSTNPKVKKLKNDGSDQEGDLKTSDTDKMEQAS